MEQKMGQENSNKDKTLKNRPFFYKSIDKVVEKIPPKGNRSDDSL